MASEAPAADQAVAETVSDVPESTSTAVDASLPKPEDLKGKEEEEKEKILTTVSDDASNSAETTLSCTEDLEEKNEEKIEAEAVHDTSSIEETSLLKPKDSEKDEEEKVKANESATVEEPTAEPEGIVEQKEDSTATEVVKEVVVENSLPEPPARVMDKTDDSPAPPVEPPPPADVPEVSSGEGSVETLPEIVTEEAKDARPSDVADDEHMEPPSESSVQEPDAVATVTLDSEETVEKPQIGESTTDVIEVSPETPNEEIPQNETLDSVTENPTEKVLRTVESEDSQPTDVPPPADEPKEDQVETVVLEIPAETEDSESAEAETSSEPVVNKEVSETTAPVNEVAESWVEPAVDADDVKQENAVDVEETATETDKTVGEKEVASDVAEAVDEVKDESKEGEVLTQDRDFVVADANKSSSKGLDAEQEPTVKQTLLDKLVSETAEDKKQDAERTPADTVKEGEEDTKADAEAPKSEVPEDTKADAEAPKSEVPEDTKADEEAPKSEVPSKKSQGGGNNLLSKVKRSIVKVKKAIIGKSPS